MITSSDRTNDLGPFPTISPIQQTQVVKELKNRFSSFKFLKLYSVPLLLSRELTGSIDERSAVPAQLYGRIQLFCRTLGHISYAYCVLFDLTGQYIFTVCWIKRKC